MPKAKKVKEVVVAEESDVQIPENVNVEEAKVDETASAIVEAPVAEVAVEPVAEVVVEEKKARKVKGPKLCGTCNGSGLVRAEFVNSEFCPTCKGSCFEPA